VLVRVISDFKPVLILVSHITNSDGFYTFKYRQRSNPNRGGKIVRKSYSHNSVPVSAPLHTYSLNHRSRDWLVDAVPTIIQRLVPIGLAVGRSTLLKIRRSSSPFCTMDILEARPEVRLAIQNKSMLRIELDNRKIVKIGSARVLRITLRTS
jgi:hypothetical protein